MENNYLKQLDQLQEDLIKLALNQPNQNEWHKEYDKKEIVIFTKLNHVGLKMTRTEFKMNLDSKKVIDILFDVTRRKEYDEHFLEGKVELKIDDNNIIFYGAGKSPMFFVDPRDMVALTRKGSLPDGTHFVISKSVELPQVPERKNFTRCEIMFSAFFIKDLGQGLCHIIIIANIDPKGSIPKALLNSGVSMQADQVKKMMEKVKQYTLKN